MCLYFSISKIKEDSNLVHFCVVYPALDFIIVTASFVCIHQVKISSQELIDNKDFTEYADDTKIALDDILYLPKEFDSDDEDVEY